MNYSKMLEILDRQLMDLEEIQKHTDKGSLLDERIQEIRDKINNVHGIITGKMDDQRIAKDNEKKK